MYNKSKNGLLFAVFILVIILIVSILVVSVYTARQTSNEEYKISLNSSIYDKNYSYIELNNDGVLKKEWDGNYYLYVNNSSLKYDLGSETVLYEKSRKQVDIYGTVYQVYSNGDISKKSKKTSINNLDDFQMFKLGDRRYLVIGDSIESENFKTNNYLIVTIDKAGNALLLNNEINIKTVHPLVVSIENLKFDIANERLISGDTVVDLKKINGSTNEYVEKEEEETNSNSNNSQNSGSNNSQNNNSNNSQIYNEIVRQITNISGLVSKSANKTSLYKNISLRTVNPHASYIDITYSVIDPENRYLSIFLALKQDDDITYYYLSKDSSEYRINGLSPNSQYELTLNYVTSDSSQSKIADSVTVLTSTDPTYIRIIKINEDTITYNVKMYNDYEFESADVAITNCDDLVLDTEPLNIDQALQSSGMFGNLKIGQDYNSQYICAEIINAKNYNNDEIKINSYHKVRIN